MECGPADMADMGGIVPTPLTEGSPVWMYPLGPKCGGCGTPPSMW